MQFFEKVEITMKKGDINKRLTLVQVLANLDFITTFISNLLPKFIHHRDQLKHYRFCIQTFLRML